MSNPPELQNLVAKDKYQVFLLSCPGNIPFFFGSHPWFVVNKKGAIARWEVLFRKTKTKDTPSSEHIHKNFLAPWRGLGVFPYFENYFSYKPTLLGYCENESARQMAECIENSPNTYPYRSTFSLTGPNSNTYAQWILDNSPNHVLKLPFNAFGKNYKRVQKSNPRGDKAPRTNARGFSFQKERKAVEL